MLSSPSPDSLGGAGGGGEDSICEVIASSPCSTELGTSVATCPATRVMAGNPSISFYKIPFSRNQTQMCFGEGPCLHHPVNSVCILLLCYSFCWPVFTILAWPLFLCWAICQSRLKLCHGLIELTLGGHLTRPTNQQNQHGQT